MGDSIYWDNKANLVELKKGLEFKNCDLTGLNSEDQARLWEGKFYDLKISSLKKTK